MALKERAELVFGRSGAALWRDGGAWAVLRDAVGRLLRLLLVGGRITGRRHLRGEVARERDARALAVALHVLADRVGEVDRVELRAVGERDAALDAALELAHVERPVVVEE